MMIGTMLRPSTQCPVQALSVGSSLKGFSKRTRQRGFSTGTVLGSGFLGMSSPAFNGAGAAAGPALGEPGARLPLRWRPPGPLGLWAGA